MMRYKISLETDCRVLKSRNLLVSAMQALPSDAKIVRILYEPDTGGYISFHSVLLNYPEDAVLNLNVTETVKLEYRVKY